ncbi:MAG: hypothetical protein LBT44_09035 [Clostridiales bacterium]|jgi:hypothetical protein|nr:hypothetical protein [Clostridiales bacterium]
MEPIKFDSVSYDGALNIAVGKCRFEVNWRNREIQWSELLRRLSETARTPETYTVYMAAKKQRQDEIKDIGGFVGGIVKGGRRKKDSVTNRSLIALDIDFGTIEVYEQFCTLYGNACALHTTHKHAPDSFRGRLIIPLARPVFCDEYQAVARTIAGQLGINSFDDTTFEPSRLMYWPSASKDGEYIFKCLDAPWLDPDIILAGYADWRDSSQWPMSARIQEHIQLGVKKQGDPREKNGLIGAFCRAYPIQDAIDTFLTEVYEPYAAASGGLFAGCQRYTYKPGSTAGGLVLYEDRFAFSHHGTDPVSGKLCNAFDLVRVHQFGLMDDNAKEETPINKLPSFLAMQDFCVKDGAVRALLLEERQAEAMEDFADVELPPDEDTTEKDWRKKLVSCKA